MSKSSMYMESTKISSAKSAGEIMRVLVNTGARQIAADYDRDGRTIGLRWTMLVHDQPVLFSMPIRTGPVFKSLMKKYKRTLSNAEGKRVEEQAERVAWRQLLRWVQAQSAMIETEMVEAAEVFSPYMCSKDGKTFWEKLSESKFKMLEGPKG